MIRREKEMDAVLNSEKNRGLRSFHVEADGITVYRYGMTDSTNLRAKAVATPGFSGNALFIAEGQSAGRGRLGRSFYSPAATGLYFSSLFSTTAPLYEFLALMPAVSVACARAIEEYCGKRVGIKWVNDLYFEEKKVCGILVESVNATCAKDCNKLVVGVGINLNTEDFPPELAGIAGSLGACPDGEKMALAVHREVQRYVARPSDRSFMEEYAARSVVVGKRVKLLRGEEVFCGTVSGFDDDGGIVLVEKGERRVFHGGEITLRLQ